MMNIRVNKPNITLKDKKAVLSALNSGWISGEGKFVLEFEQKFAALIDMPYAVSVSNGTVGLHLALITLGIGKGDDILIPDLTIISCALAAVYQQANPIFVDVDPNTAGIDLIDAERLITSKTKAIMVVHLYGQPVLMNDVVTFAKKHNLLIIEDCSQAFGALSGSKKVGSFGDASVFSLYANKTITTGEGGIVLFKKRKYKEEADRFKNLYHSKKTRFLHNLIGYNYRCSNVLTAIGIEQLNRAQVIVKKKESIKKWYLQGLTHLPFIEFQQPIKNTTPVCWMFPIYIKKKAPFSRHEIKEYLEAKGIETRFFFVPLHQQPALQPFIKNKNKKFPVSCDLYSRGIYLPSGVGHSKKEIQYVISAITNFINEKTDT